MSPDVLVALVVSTVLGLWASARRLLVRPPPPAPLSMAQVGRAALTAAGVVT